MHFFPFIAVTRVANPKTNSAIILFADLFGSLSGQAESSEEEIDAILYKLPATEEDPS